MTVASLRRLLAAGAVDPDATTVLVNTGDGLKTLDVVASAAQPTHTITASLGAFRASGAAQSRGRLRMSVTVRIPTPMRQLTGGAAEVTVDGSSVRDVVQALQAAHPGVADRVLDETGTLRRFVNVYVGDEDVRYLDGLDTPVPDGATVSIIPAVAGGCRTRPPVLPAAASVRVAFSVVGSKERAQPTPAEHIRGRSPSGTRGEDPTYRDLRPSIRTAGRAPWHRAP